ncbi:MAG: 54S ribosomal protein L22, mitochondrial [Watsoniomyces obsoletus]|nr:MAG: 54S ribosomal protein L22, mitochondrial [Watsoniomyces obsoletus]
MAPPCMMLAGSGSWMQPIYHAARRRPWRLLRISPLTARRSLFGFGFKSKGKTEADVRNPVYEEFLKTKPPPPPTIRQGDLAESTIFTPEETGEDPAKVAKSSESGRPPRDPTIMAAVLDPQPELRRRWERKMVIRDIRRRGRRSRTEKLKMTERECLSKSHFIKTSVKKLGPLARQIAGKTVDDAIVQMRFSKKKAAKEVKEHLEHARNEAIVRRGMSLGETNGTKGEPVKIETKEGRRRTVTDRTNLYIDQAWVGRGPYGSEVEPRAMGRTNILRPPSTSISLVLKEEATRIRQHKEREEKRRNRKLWVALPNRPISAQQPYYSW